MAFRPQKKQRETPKQDYFCLSYEAFMKHLILALTFIVSFSVMAQEADKVDAQQLNQDQQIKSISGGECHDTSMGGCAATKNEMTAEESINAKTQIKYQDPKGNNKGPGKGIEISTDGQAE